MGQKIKSGQYFAALRAKRDNPTAALILEDGSVFTGYGFGAATTNVGEICFNTSMTGYQEIFTDPSYFGQIMVTTNAHIGNYGVKPEDVESSSVKINGLIGRNLEELYSRKQANGSLSEYLKSNGVVAVVMFLTVPLIPASSNSNFLALVLK